MRVERVELSEKLNLCVIDKAVTIEALRETQGKLEEECITTLAKLQHLRVTAKEMNETRDVLSSRNEAMREKLDQLERIIGEDGAHVKDETKGLFSLLGMKLTYIPDDSITTHSSFRCKRNAHNMGTFLSRQPDRPEDLF